MDFFIMVIYFAFWMVGNILQITKEEKKVVLSQVGVLGTFLIVYLYIACSRTG